MSVVQILEDHGYRYNGGYYPVNVAVARAKRGAFESQTYSRSVDGESHQVVVTFHNGRAEIHAMDATGKNLVTANVDDFSTATENEGGRFCVKSYFESRPDLAPKISEGAFSVRAVQSALKIA